MEFNERRFGKSFLTNEFVEYLLDSGKRVLCSSPGHTVLKWRVGHLTLLENVHAKKVEPTIFYDENL